jgi:hypothetical protein
VSSISITIRDEIAPDDAVVLLHLGGFDRRSVATKVANIVKRHDEWIGIFDSAGRFAVSVYALTSFSLTDVLARMPHGQYGLTTAGAIRSARFALVPTSISMRGMLRSVAELQPYHFSIVFRSPGSERRLSDALEEAFEETQSMIRAELEALLGLFEKCTRDRQSDDA